MYTSILHLHFLAHNLARDVPVKLNMIMTYRFGNKIFHQWCLPVLYKIKCSKTKCINKIEFRSVHLSFLTARYVAARRGAVLRGSARRAAYSHQLWPAPDDLHTTRVSAPPFKYNHSKHWLFCMQKCLTGKTFDTSITKQRMLKSWNFESHMHNDLFSIYLWSTFFAWCTDSLIFFSTLT